MKHLKNNNWSRSELVEFLNARGYYVDETEATVELRHVVIAIQVQEAKKCASMPA